MVGKLSNTTVQQIIDLLTFHSCEMFTLEVQMIFKDNFKDFLRCFGQVFVLFEIYLTGYVLRNITTLPA